MFLSIESIMDRLSTVLLVPDNVLVVSIVNSTTSLTLASMVAPAEIFKLFVMSRNRTMSVMLLPRFITLPVNIFTVMESANSFCAENCLDDESNICDVSEVILFPASSLDNESSSDNISVELLDPENSLVMSVVNKTISDGFLMAVSNLEFVSLSNNISSIDLVLVEIDAN